MRHIKLIISSFIAIVGLFIYFISLPEVDEEALVHLTVEAGDEELLNDFYFNGSLYNYSSFQLKEESVHLFEDLSYLEQLDAPEDQNLYLLQKEYPRFMNKVLHNRSTSSYYLVNSDDYLISGHFEMARDQYLTYPGLVYLSTFNKETNEIETHSVKREDTLPSNHVSVMGIYEDYPRVKVLYNAEVWPDEESAHPSVLTVGDYNFETKNYTETPIQSNEGDFYNQEGVLYDLENNYLQIMYHSDIDSQLNENTDSGPRQFSLFNFNTDTMTPLEQENVHYFVEDNQLYALEINGEGEYKEVNLRTYDDNGTEVTEEISLDLEIPLNIHTESPKLVTAVVDNHLYLTQSLPSEELNQIEPTSYQVFDIESGESLLIGKIDFNMKNEISSSGAVIDGMGQIADLNN